MLLQVKCLKHGVQILKIINCFICTHVHTHFHCKERDAREVRGWGAGEYRCTHKVNTSAHVLKKSESLHMLPTA